VHAQPRCLDNLFRDDLSQGVVAVSKLQYTQQFFVGSGQSIRLPARRIDHDGVFAEQPLRIIPAPAAMMPRTKIGRSRVEVDARECADVIFGGCPEVLRVAPQVGYSAAAHKAAAKSTTDVAPANSTTCTATAGRP
jgi:hypothetical protein